MRAAGDWKPNAIRVMSRILVLTVIWSAVVEVAGVLRVCVVDMSLTEGMRGGDALFPEGGGELEAQGSVLCAECLDLLAECGE
jgi:hypothetical protein